MQELLCSDGNVQATEIWKDIRGYEGRYQVSNLGRVKSLARTRRGKSGCEVPVPEIIMKLYRKKDDGRSRPYEEVRFRNGGPRTEHCKAFLVHRLVADAFIKQLEPNEQVDHINGVHYDNRVENLRVMHYVEHAKLHPRIVDGSFSKLGTLGAARLRAQGWKPKPYKRTAKMHKNAGTASE